MSILKKALTTAALATALIATGAHAETKRIALVVKALGIGFFEAANKGAQEAAADKDTQRNHGHDQRGAQLGGLVEIGGMAAMQDVEHPVGEDQRTRQMRDSRDDGVAGQDFGIETGRHAGHSTRLPPSSGRRRTRCDQLARMMPLLSPASLPPGMRPMTSFR